MDDAAAAIWPSGTAATRLTTAAAAAASGSAIPTRPSHPGEVLKEWSSLIGIVTAIVGNVLIALALNVQRYAHTRLHREHARVRRRARALTRSSRGNGHGGAYGTLSGPVQPVRSTVEDGVHEEEGGEEDQKDQEAAAPNYLRSPYWWLGQFLITLGEMGNFLAYGFAPASIVSPLGVVALVSNCIIAPVMFHERFRARDFWGVVIAVAGVVTVVLSANQEETRLEPDDVWNAITTTAFEIYLGVTTLSIVALMWASSRCGRRTILIDLGLVGLFGGYTALATKGVSSMLSSTLWRAFATPVTYVLGFVLLVTAVMQIRYVNKALQRFDSTQVIPIQFVLFTLCVILGSAVLYRDFEKTTPRQAARFVGGCLLTFFGVFLITSGRQQKVEEEGGEGDDDVDGPLLDVCRTGENIGLDRHDQGVVAPHPIEVGGPSTPVEMPCQASWSSSTSSSLPRMHSRTPPASSPSAKPPSAPEPAAGGDRAVAIPARRPGAAPVCPSEPPPPPPPTMTTTTTPRPSTGVSRTQGRRHRSKTFISPSPLSSTVTTVVKDAFLWDNDASSAQRSSLRRFQSSIRARLFFDDGADDEARYAELPTSEALCPGLQGRSRPGRDASRKRSLSVSDALRQLPWFCEEWQETETRGGGGSLKTSHVKAAIFPEAVFPKVISPAATVVPKEIFPETVFPKAIFPDAISPAAIFPAATVFPKAIFPAATV